MKRLKNLLQYDASKYIFIALSACLYIFTKTAYIAIILLVVLSLIIFRKSRNLLIYSLIFIVIINIRMQTIDNKEKTLILPETGKIKEVYDDHFILKSKFNWLIYYKESSDLQPGMIIDFKAYEYHYEERNIIHNFSYAKYLKSKNIVGVISAYNIKIIDKKPSLYTLKFQLQRKIDSKYDESIAKYIKLFIIGDKSSVQDEISTKANLLGISHLFAISGMHLALFIGLINKLLNFLYLKKSTHNSIIITFLILYNFITGFLISVIRASLLCITLFLTKDLKVLLTKTDLLSFSFLGFLVFNPYIMYNVGFQLSYLMAFSIIMGEHIIKTSGTVKKVLNLSIYASLVSLPIILNLNKTYGFLNIFANVYFVLFVSYIFLPSTILVFLIPKLGIIYKKIIQMFETSVNLFTKYNISFHFSISNPIYILIYWSFLYVLFIRIQKKQKLKNTIISFVAFLFISYNLNFIPAVDFVRILDVNQGDSIHIHSQTCNMLIDTGSLDQYDSIENYLHGSDIKVLDYLVITHFHEDHYGETNKLIREFTIENIYVNRIIGDSPNLTVLKEGDIFACGNIDFYVLNANNDSKNENNNSIVLLSQIQKDQWLFTGDIEYEVEKKIVEKYDLDIDILKIPHHGSKTSSSNLFLNHIKPDIGIISVGETNEYNLPDQEILDRYDEYGIELFRTNVSGSITFYYPFRLNIRIIETYHNYEKKKYLINLIQKTY